MLCRDSLRPPHGLRCSSAGRVEPGTLRFKEAEVPILREFLLRGGTADLRRLPRPDRVGQRRAASSAGCSRIGQIVDLPPTIRSSHCFYEIDHYPQVPGLGSFFQGRTWEKGGFVSHLRAIEDDRGRAMVLINWNTDMGDGMEWSNATDTRATPRIPPTPIG